MRWSESGDQPVQRENYFVLVDEADSILIDEARTPLIIGSLEDKKREPSSPLICGSAARPKFCKERALYR